MNSLKNKTVFISGASIGIGKSCAEYFAKNGSNLILCARSIDILNEFSQGLIKKYNIEVITFKLDVRERYIVKETIDNLPDKWKKIDILINNAGLARGLEKIHEGNIDDWEEMIDTNIKGLLYLTKSIIPLMIKNNYGHIINIGSIAGTQAYPNGTVYCATKAAVKFISDGLRMELVDKPIRVTNVQPGAVETNFSVVRFHGDKNKADNFYKGFKPLSPDDIADAVVYCAGAPQNIQISEITIIPECQASAMIIHREK